MLSDSLYFKNLGNNSGAFYSLLNSSEEEVFKETILAYSFYFQPTHFGNERDFKYHVSLHCD